MNRIRSMPVAGVCWVLLAGLVLAPTLAHARAVTLALPGTNRALVIGSYAFTCQPSTAFPGTPSYIFQSPATPTCYSSGVIASPPACAGSFALMTACYPAGGVPYAYGRVIGKGAAGLMKFNNAVATSPDTLTDSLAVSVNRGTPGQVTLSIGGYAQHLNPDAVNTGVISRLSVDVYPDTTNAKAGTNRIAFGEMDFYGSAKQIFEGIFTSADFTTPQTIGDGNDYQVNTVPALQKVVTVPNAATATVVVTVDPDAVDPVLPASSPLSLALLSLALLGGACWFLTRRQSRTVA